MNYPVSNVLLIAVGDRINPIYGVLNIVDHTGVQVATINETKLYLGSTMMLPNGPYDPNSSSYGQQMKPFCRAGSQPSECLSDFDHNISVYIFV